MINYIIPTLFFLISRLLADSNFRSEIKRNPMNKNQLLYTQCGISSDWNFKNWAHNIISNSPTVFPKNDNELRSYLKTIKENNCKARPVGCTGSAGGLVLEKNSTDTVAVSLAFYEPDDKEWQMQLVSRNNQSLVVLPGGKTLLDLASIIKPDDFFTPTQTAGFIFAMGGVMANTVHGGAYNKGYFNYYFTRMRVMLSSGEIRVIDDKEEIKYWRQSFGLLGMMTSLEIQLEEQTDFRMATIKHEFKDSNFSRDDFANALAETRTNNEIYGEFFFDAYDQQLISITFRNNKGDRPKDNKGCYWDYPGVHCAPVAFCTYQYRFGDLTLSQSCRLRTKEELVGTYKLYHESFPNIPTSGVPTSFRPGDPYGKELAEVIKLMVKFPPLAHDANLCKLLSRFTFMATERLVQNSQTETDDGYWVRTAARTNLMGYFFPVDKLYDALKIYMNNVYSLVNKTNKVSKYTDFKFNQPCEFRFVTLNSTLASKYQIPMKEGDYVVLEALHLIDQLDDFKWGFAQLEHEWQQIPGAVPHLGKLWGFDYSMVEKGMIPQPFSTKFTRSIMSEDQKSEFNGYRVKVDPDGVFLGGLAAEFFK